MIGTGSDARSFCYELEGSANLARACVGRARDSGGDVEPPVGLVSVQFEWAPWRNPAEPATGPSLAAPQPAR